MASKTRSQEGNKGSTAHRREPAQPTMPPFPLRDCPSVRPKRRIHAAIEGPDSLARKLLYKSMLCFKRLNFSRPRPIGETVHVLRDITLDILDGSFVSIIGPSGCGKTSLLRLVAGLEVPEDLASLEIDGHTPDRARATGRIGFVFQQPVLFPWRTARDNIQLPLEIAGRPASDSQLDELLGLVGLQGFGDMRPRQLSGGMQSRVAIARALATRPQVLLLDEPFADLDEINRERMNLELQRVYLETRATMLFVTHDLEEAVFLADRVVVLSSRPGCIAEIIDIPLPRPRPVEVFESNEFEHCLTAARRALRRSTGSVDSV